LILVQLRDNSNTEMSDYINSRRPQWAQAIDTAGEGLLQQFLDSLRSKTKAADTMTPERAIELENRYGKRFNFDVTEKLSDDDNIERLRILQDREIKKYPDTKNARVSSDEEIQRLRDLQDQEINKYQIEPTTEDTDSSDEPPTTELPPAPTTLVPETSYADLVNQVADDRYNALAAQFDVEGVRNAQMQDFASQYVPAEGTPEFPDYQEALVDLRDQGLYNSETGVAPGIPTASPSEARNIFLNSAGSSLDGLKAMEAALGLRYAGGKYYLNVGGSPTEVSNAGARALKRGEIDAQALIDNPMYGALVQETPSTTPSRAQQPNFSQLKAYEPQSVQNMEPDVFNKPAEDFNRAHQTPAETNFEELRKHLQGMGSEFQPYFSDFSDPFLSPNDYPDYPYLR
jgi:hypothetical protein